MERNKCQWVVTGILFFSKNGKTLAGKLFKATDWND
jgi:hypothetical protein